MQIGEVLLYGTNGVCRLDDVRTEKLGMNVRTYYILTPIRNSNSTIFVPEDNLKLVGQMRSLLTAEELSSLFSECADREEEAWISDARARSEYYKSILASGERAPLLSALRTLYVHRAELGAKGKQLCVSDESFFTRVEEIFVDELSTVLSLSREDGRVWLYRSLRLEK